MLAIIIPYFKLTFFEATLQSLASQTNQNFKVYVGNDASPENPEFLINNFQKRINLEYHVFNQNLGGKSLVQQWIRCIAMTEYENWIMILGDDDVISENFVANFYYNIAEINQQKINVVRFATQVINESGHPISDIYKHPIIEPSTDFLARKFSKKTRSSLSEYVFKKEIMLHFKFRNLPLAWHADDLAVLEFSEFCNVFSINESTVFVRVSDINITGNDKYMVVKNQATFDFCKILFSEFSEKFSTNQLMIILKKLEIAFGNIPSFKNYFIISKYYLLKVNLVAFVEFQYRMIKYLTIQTLLKINLFTFVNSLRKK